MKNSYRELQNKHEKEFNSFPIFFAFDNEQFKKGMNELGLNENDTDKIYSTGNGGYYKKSDSKILHDMIEKHENELQNNINNDTTGEGFIYDMFKYELVNHEYEYTGEIDDTLNALDMTIKDINSNKNLIYGLNKALKEYD